mgnify:CR=1 FL=1
MRRLSVPRTSDMPLTGLSCSVAAENRQVPQGPCGVAFLGDVAMGAYTLLLYKSQEHHLARVPFTDQFKLETTVRRPPGSTAADAPPQCNTRAGAR